MKTNGNLKIRWVNGETPSITLDGAELAGMVETFRVAPDGGNFGLRVELVFGPGALDVDIDADTVALLAQQAGVR